MKYEVDRKYYWKSENHEEYVCIFANEEWALLQCAKEGPFVISQQNTNFHPALRTAKPVYLGVYETEMKHILIGSHIPFDNPEVIPKKYGSASRLIDVVKIEWKEKANG